MCMYLNLVKLYIYDIRCMYIDQNCNLATVACGSKENMNKSKHLSC